MRTSYIIPTTAILLACGSAATSPSDSSSNTPSEVPAMYKAFTGDGVSVS